MTRLDPNRLSGAFAKPHPALVCFITAGDGDTAAMPKDSIILANLCGRGDKNVLTVAENLGVEM